MIFKCRGTLGDSYIVNCVIYGLAEREPILIKQCHTYWGFPTDDWEPSIKQIYSLQPNIEVEFVSREELDAMGVPRLWPSIELARKENICPITPHPAFVFPTTEQLPVDNYIAVSPRGGKSTEHRQIEFDEIASIIEEYPEYTFVLVGSNPEFAAYEGHNIINLIDRTSILEAMGIVIRAHKFIGVQGLMAYVALSQRVQSAVYTQSVGLDKAFRSRLMPEWREYCQVYRKHRSENNEAFEQFIR